MIDLILEKKCHLINIIDNNSMHIYCLQKKRVWVKYYIYKYKKPTNFSIDKILKTVKKKR